MTVCQFDSPAAFHLNTDELAVYTPTQGELSLVMIFHAKAVAVLGSIVAWDVAVALGWVVTLPVGVAVTESLYQTRI